MGNFWVSLWIDHPIVFGQKTLYIVVLSPPVTLYIVCFQATMQNYYFVDFYMCRWYSNGARRTKQNKAIGEKVLEKAKTSYPFVLTWKSPVFSRLHLYFDNWIPFHKKATQAEKALCEMGLLCTYEHNH